MARLNCFIIACLLLTGFRAAADGPHWQLPSPWTEYEMENEGRPRPPKVGTLPKFPNNPNNPSPFVCPSRFDLMDDECIKYFETHCAIKYPGNKSEFYLMIMDKAGQAFAEVQGYCPCPDSYPLWHSEESRDFMRWAAGEIWLASTRLPAKDAMACAKYIVNYYVTALRFTKDPDLVKTLADFIEYNKKCAELADKLANEPDVKKHAKLIDDWRAVAKGPNMGQTQVAIKLLDGVKNITGDIKFVHEMTISNMTLAIINMGPGMLIPLAEALKKVKNPEVAKALAMVGQEINRNAAKPKPVAPPARPTPKAPPPQPVKAPEPVAKKPEAPKPEAPKEPKKPGAADGE